MSGSSLASVVDAARLLRGRLPARRPAMPARPQTQRDDFAIVTSARGLARIEHCLRACPAIENAFVAERSDRPDGRNLVAYVQLRQGCMVGGAQIRVQLALLLPPELLPSTFVTIDALPLLASGQIDYAALPCPDSAALGTRQYEEPFGPAEKAIAAIWRELLGVEQVGRNAHFFELGGHSSLAVQLVYRINQQMKVSVTMRELFLEPVLHRFAAATSKRMHASRLTQDVPASMSGATASWFGRDAGVSLGALFALE